MTTSPQPDREAKGGPGSAELGRGPLPTPVEVLLGGRWTATTAHGVRHGRRDAQALIGQPGRLIWISLDRVRRPAKPQAPQAPQQQAISSQAVPADEAKPARE
jgi:hypothetical protein